MVLGFDLQGYGVCRLGGVRAYGVQGVYIKG